MPFERGDIIEIPFNIPPNNRIENHPAVIISNDAVFDTDECYICAMMTHSTHIDRFSFVIDPNMLSKEGDGQFSQVRCHLITYVLESHIIRNSNRNRMRSNAVDRLVQRILATSLEV